MVFSLRTNISALRGVRILGSTMFELGRVSERLASGQRIQNDAAGQAIADSLSFRARVFSQGRRNTSDAVSFLTIADSTLEQVTNLTARMQELVQQGANGAFSKEQRTSMQEEVNALDQEIRRITSSSKFNGMQVFDRSPNSGERILAVSHFSGITSYSTDPRGRYVEYEQGILPADSISFYDSIEEQSLTLSSATLSSWIGGGFINSVSAKGYTLDDKVVISIEYDSSKEDMFLYDFATGSVNRLTESVSAADQSQATISADGSTIFFLARSEYVDGGTSDDATGTTSTNPQLYAVHPEKGVIWTNGEEFSGGVSDYYISPDGTKVVFKDGSGKYASLSIGEEGFGSSNLIGKSALNMNVRAITDDGRIIATSTSDLAGNGNSLLQLFEIDITTGATQQLTNFQEDVAMSAVSVSLDGTIVTFASASDPTGQNAEGNTEFFQLDRITGDVFQLTDGDHGALSNVVISADGKKAFATNGDGDLHQYNLAPDEKRHIFQMGFGTSGTIAAGVADIRGVISGLGSIQVTSQAAAREGINTLASNLSGIGDLRGRIGSSLSRLSYAENTIALQRDELIAAESRIRDANIAEDAAKLVGIQILQQAGVATLAQANAQPSLLLRLLNF